MTAGESEQKVGDPGVQFNRVVPQRFVARIKGWNSEQVENSVTTNPDTAKPDHNYGDQQCVKKMVHGRCGPTQHAGIGYGQSDAACLTPDEPQKDDKRQYRTDSDVQATNGQPRCSAREEPDALTCNPKADHQGSAQPVQQDGCRIVVSIEWTC